MSGKLALNSYLQMVPAGDDAEEFVLAGPTKTNGFQAVQISKGSRPKIFEIFSDLASTSLDFLQPEKDLDAADRAFLTKAGFLGEPGSLPKLPAFACDLHDVGSSDSPPDHQSLKVNDHLRFEPFDLRTFGTKLRDQHLSPTRPTVWVRSLVYEIEQGYWLEPAEADIVSRFVPGGSVPEIADNEMLSRMIAAEILLEESLSRKLIDERKQLIASANRSFNDDGYALIPAILPDHQMSAYRRFYRDYVREGFMPFGDKQVANRYRQHNEPLAKFLHKTLQPLMSQIAGTDVIPSYVYAASYKDGASLAPHTDRPQCEFSISFQVDYLPEPAGHVSPWALSVEPLGGRKRSELGWDTVDRNSAKSFYLASGDGLFYKGCELVHYRDELPEGHSSTSLFFHFVPSDFEGSLE